MKILHYFTIILATIVAVSCGPSKKAYDAQYQAYPNYGGYQPQQGYPQQSYPQQQGPETDGYSEISLSPIEVLSFETGTNEIRSFGSGESGNEQMALNAARAQAVAALQEKIEVYVKAGLDRYTQETGVNGAYSLDETERNQVQTAVKGIVNGASLLKTRKLYNKHTKRYKYEVCMKYDRAGVISAIQQQCERIIKDEKRFEKDMQAAWDELDAQNNRISLGEQRQMRQNDMQQQNLDRQHQRDMEKSNQQNQYNLQQQNQQNQYDLQQQRQQNQYNLQQSQQQNQYNLQRQNQQNQYNLQYQQQNGKVD